MKKILALLTITALLTGGTIAMSNELEQPFKKGEINPYNKYFTGTTYLTRLSENDCIWNSSIANVTFDPGEQTGINIPEVKFSW